jgi:hypothetical protein
MKSARPTSHMVMQDLAVLERSSRLGRVTQVCQNTTERTRRTRNREHERDLEQELSTRDGEWMRRVRNCEHKHKRDLSTRAGEPTGRARDRKMSKSYVLEKER